MKKTEHESPPVTEEFLSRWSRRKEQARADSSVAPAAAQPADDEPVPTLPPVDELRMESDYSGFLHPKVDESLRRAALKKLFSDPHFSIIDGLDIYLDDYSISDPLPAAMLGQLKQARNILDWAAERKASEAARERAAEDTSAPTREELAAAPGATENPPDAAIPDEEMAAVPIQRHTDPDSGAQNA